MDFVGCELKPEVPCKDMTPAICLMAMLKDDSAGAENVYLFRSAVVDIMQIGKKIVVIKKDAAVTCEEQH